MEEKIEIPQEAIYPPEPPDYIFKNRGNRNAPSMSVAENYQTWLFDKIDYTQDKGILFYYQGIDKPRHGFPFATAVYAINGIKRTIIGFLHILASKQLILSLLSIVFLSKKSKIALLTKICNSLVGIADVSLFPYYLKKEYYCPAANTFRRFIFCFLSHYGIEPILALKVADIFAMILEFDDAYRYRFQDIMNETSVFLLLQDFQREIQRLVLLESQRETCKYNSAQFSPPKKVKIIGTLLSFLWFLPSFRRAFTYAIQCIDFKEWQLDDNDIFHTLPYVDYNVRGKTFAEREKEFMAYYDNDPEKLPLRIQIKLTS